MEAIQVIDICPTTKQQCADFVQKLISEVDAGTVNPLDLHIKLVAIEKALGEVKKAISDGVLREAEKYGQKTFAHQSAEITVCAVKTEYDYKVSKDSEWERLDSEINDLTDRKKEREKFLKSLGKPMTLVNEESGEIDTIYPPLKIQKDGIRVTLL